MNTKFCVYILIVLSLECVSCWKPIVGQHSFANAFSLKQIHPQVTTKEFSSHSNILFENELSTVESQQHRGTHIVHNGQSLFEDGLDEFKEQNLGYSLDKDLHFRAHAVIKDSNCGVKKFAFNHDGIVHYEANLPVLDQYTICFWTRFTNHSGDHVLLTYSGLNDPRAIQLWVANSQNSSFISMAIKGQQMFRLNYPLRTRQWHHICSSWNGKTGEWQLWVNAERIGRGFHNSLVGHKIPAKGELFSGGSSVTGKVTEGLHFEITFVQVYKVALSAGKAHKDHKHHHVHHYDHEGKELLITTTSKPANIKTPYSMENVLKNGQPAKTVQINLASPTSILPYNPQLSDFFMSGIPYIDPIRVNTNFLNSPPKSRKEQIVELSVEIPQLQTTATTQTQTFKFLNQGEDPKFIDEIETKINFKRSLDKQAKDLISFDKQNRVLTRQSVEKSDNFRGSRDVLEGLANFASLRSISDLARSDNLIDATDREAAEGEVKAIMSLCSACEVEPFQGAVVFSWRLVIDKMDNALKGVTMGNCGSF